MENPDPRQAVPIQSIRRALDALDYLAEQGLAGEGASLQAVAAHLEVPPTTAHNILRTMVACGYVGREGNGRYGLGARCRDLLRGARFAGGGLDAAAAVVHGLAARTGESVVLTTLAQGRRRVLVRAEGHEVLRVSPALEERGVFWERVTGRVLAAYASPAELQEILCACGMPGAAWGGIETERSLEPALAAVRAAGCAQEMPSALGVVALAAPVLDERRHLLGALGVYLPVTRAGEERLQWLRAELLSASRRLGTGEA